MYNYQGLTTHLCPEKGKEKKKRTGKIELTELSQDNRNAGPLRNKGAEKIRFILKRSGRVGDPGQNRGNKEKKLFAGGTGRQKK